MGKVELPDERWLELYNKGLSDYRIAKILGVSRELIRYRRKRLGLKANFTAKKDRFLLLRDEFKELWWRGLTYREIRKKLGVASGTIVKWRKRLNLPKRNRRRLPQDDLRKQAFFLFKVHKKDFVEIAQELRIPPKKVRELIGFALMDMCRRDEKCPYKPLLPEARV